MIVHDCKCYLSGYGSEKEVTYCDKETEINSKGKCKSKIDLLVNRLTSEQSLLPYEYSQ